MRPGVHQEIYSHYLQNYAISNTRRPKTDVVGCLLWGMLYAMPYPIHGTATLIHIGLGSVAAGGRIGTFGRASRRIPGGIVR